MQSAVSRGRSLALALSAVAAGALHAGCSVATATPGEDAGATEQDGGLPLDAGARASDSGLADAGRQDASTPRARVLLVTCSAGYQHEVVTRGAGGEPSLVETTIAELAAELGAEVSTLYDPAELAATTPEAMASVDAFVFFTSGELPFPDATRAAVIDRVRAGAGLVGIHSATDTFRAWTPWAETIGATQYADLPDFPWCECHPWHQAVIVNVEDRASAITAHLGDRWSVLDEIYQFDDFSRDRVHVLLSLDRTSVDLSRASRTDGDFGLAWTRNVGSGRVFYLALGHEPALFGDVAYRTLLHEGLSFAIGR